MRKQNDSYLYGTMILAAGVVVVKLIGALFKIPLTNLLGGVGMSCFNVAYDLYYPLYALFISGVPVAVSKLVSESMAQSRARDAHRLLRVSLLVFLLVGAVGSVVMYAGAARFTMLVNNPDAQYAVKALSPALFFGCATAALRGYRQGLQDMRPTAVSQILEAIAKLVLGLGFAWLISSAGMRQFALEGNVFGSACVTPEQARLVLLPYAAAGAIFGVACSTVCGTIYLALRHKYGAPGISLSCWRASPTAEPMGRLAKKLLRIAIPVCVASLIANLTSFIDLISVMNRLTHAISQSGNMLLTLYQHALPDGVGLERLAAYLYGCYSGMAVPLYNLVPALVATIGVSLLPAVAASWTRSDRRALSRDVSSALRITAILAFPAGLGMSVLAEPIMRMLYFSRPMEVTAIYPVLRIMGISSIFVALTLPLHAVLQATGRAGLTVKLLLIGGCCKLTCNYLLVGIPQLNIHAAPVGTLVCYGLVFFASLYALLNMGIELSVADTFGKPFVAGIGCALTAYFSHQALLSIVSEMVSTLGAIVLGGGIYIFLLLITKTIRKIDVFLLPKGEKFAKTLEKYHLLG